MPGCCAPEARLPLVAMAAPALCQLTPAQFHDFIRCVEALVQADNKRTLFEFALERLLIRHVVSHFVGAQPASVKYTTFAPLTTPVAVVLAALAYAGEQTPEGAARAFAAGVDALGWPGVRLDLGPPGFGRNRRDRSVTGSARPRGPTAQKAGRPGMCSLHLRRRHGDHRRGRVAQGRVRLPWLSHAAIPRVGLRRPKRDTRQCFGPVIWRRGPRRPHATMMPMSRQHHIKTIFVTKPRSQRSALNLHFIRGGTFEIFDSFRGRPSLPGASP